MGSNKSARVRAFKQARYFGSHTQLDLARRCQENVAGLDVAVDNVVRVQVLEALEDLVRTLPDLGLVQSHLKL